MGIPGIPEDGRSFGAVFRQIMREGLGRTAEQRSERRDWSRAELAHALGWDPKTVGNWLNDKVSPSDRNMDELAALLRRTEPDDHPLLVELRAAREALRRDQAQVDAATNSLPLRPDEPRRSSDRARLVSHARELAQGEFYIPLPAQIVADEGQIPIHLRLVFLGTAKVTTRRGTVVFCISSAQLNVSAGGGRIVKHNSEFERGWSSETTKIRVIPNNAGEVAYSVSAVDETRPLSGNVLMIYGDDTYVRLFDVSAENAETPVKVRGSVTFDVEGLSVDLKHSELKATLPETQQKIERMQARLAACVLKECKERTVEIPEVIR